MTNPENQITSACKYCGHPAEAGHSSDCPKHTPELLEASATVRSELESSISEVQRTVEEMKEPSVEDVVQVTGLFNKARNLMIRATQISALLVGGLELQYLRTHEQVTVGAREDGEIVFHHPDAVTDHILNYIAGAETLSEEERLGFIQKALVWNGKNFGKDIQETSSAMSREELTSLILEEFPELATNTQEAEKGIDDMLEVIPAQHDYNKDMYTAIWKLEQEAGAPYLRWTVGPERFEDGQMNVPQYNPLTNTIYVYPLDPLELFAHEIPHAKQFADRPVGAAIDGAQAVLRIATKVIGGKSLRDAQSEEYGIPGSLEYEAHEDIQPQVEEVLGL